MLQICQQQAQRIGDRAVRECLPYRAAALQGSRRVRHRPGAPAPRSGIARRRHHSTAADPAPATNVITSPIRGSIHQSMITTPLNSNRLLSRLSASCEKEIARAR